MTAILSGLINRMIAAGMSPGEAGSIAAELYAAGAASVAFGSSNAERQKRYRDRKKRNESVTPNVTNRNETVTERNTDTVTETVTNRNETVTSNASDKTPLTKNSNSKNSKRQNRGTRIAPDWSPSDAERTFAKQQGFSDFEVQRQADNFRDWWTACASSKAVKLDWSATWQHWVRNSAERAGKAPVSDGPTANCSQNLDWDAALTFFKRTGHWSRHAPRSDISEAPPELLAKHGLMPDGRPLQ